MQRFLITNTDKFTGQAELVYNDAGTLCIIDCSDTDMNENTMHHFKGVAPVVVGNLSQAFKAPTVIVEAGFDISFDKFYKDYPLKRNRYRAKSQWLGMARTERRKAWHCRAFNKRYCNRNQWYNPMIPDAYLTRKEFETEWSKVK